MKKILKANEFLKKGEYDQAIPIYEKILKTNDIAEVL